MLNKIIKNFEKISKIPRCSNNEKQILIFFQEWAKSKNFNYNIDSVGNIVIYIPATKGRENDETIILQNHMDMVCVKDKDSNHNFKADEIKIKYLEDSKGKTWIKADKTTLGSDNGIGLAIAMYLSEIKNHPTLEILITSNEEIGLIGALGLDFSLIKGTKLINIDTEDLGDICISSAGGVRIDIEKEIIKTPLVSSHNINIFKLFIGGMKGGHSGVEIEKNRGNTIFSFLEFLDNYSKDFKIFEMKGGVADNAIPKEIEIIISVENDFFLKKQLDLFIANIKNKFDAPDVFYELDVEYADLHTLQLRDLLQNSISKNDFKELIKPILNTKIGVIEMSKNIKNLVKTSTNLGIFNFQDGKITICLMSRSSSPETLKKIKKNTFNNFSDFNINIGEEYPGWEENPNSDFIKKITEIYKKNNKGIAKTVAYHAGLECGALVERLGGGIQAISIGPTIKNAHTTEEKCKLNSVEIIAKILKEYLEN